MRNRLIPAAAALAALGLIAAGCGSSNSSGGAYGGGSKTTSTAAAASGAATVSTAKNKLGTILVDNKGKTLYLFQKDSGGKSACSGGCAAVWPPLTTKGQPAAGNGVDASKLGTTKRSDGSTEVTYNGHPLYYYASDQSAGQTTGQGINSFGAQWFVLNPSGDQVQSGGSSSSNSGSAPNTGGGAY